MDLMRLKPLIISMINPALKGGAIKVNAIVEFNLLNCPGLQPGDNTKISNGF
jgi:hypothetical protein